MGDTREEAMELSPESNIVSNLHNFSFDVSWSHDLSPPILRRDILSPARFNHCSSTPHQHYWKPKPTEHSHRADFYSPTVKVSQKNCKNYFGEADNLRRQSLSPMETDHMDQDYDSHISQTELRKSRSFGLFPERLLSETPIKRKDLFTERETNPAFKEVTSTPRERTFEHREYTSTPRKLIPNSREVTDTPKLIKSVSRETKIQNDSKLSESVRRRRLNNNNNIKDDFDLDDTVFVSDSYVSRMKKESKSSAGLQEKKSSVFVLLFVVLLSGCIGIYLYLQVDSCAVFDIDVVKLRHKLEDNVYGQHIAVKSVLEGLDAFEKNVKSGSDQRTLVMAFHGWTGVGKNYISKFISEAFYNARVFLYLIPLHFAHVDQSDGVIQSWITGNITKCGVNVVIMDEIDKATPPLLDEIQGAVEYVKHRQHESHDGATRPIVVFIFISNSKSNQINQYLFSQLVNDRERELIRIQEFDGIFHKSSSEWYHAMKSKNLVDFFVPFFPLAESHVKQCIIKEFIKRGRDPDEEMIISVMNELSFFDMGGHNGQMSLTGCKRVQDKVDLHIED